MRPRRLLAVFVLVGHASQAQVTNSTIAVADAFLCTGSANYQNGADLRGLNFGAAGTLVIAPPSSPAGEFQSLVRFDSAPSRGRFDSVYGSNNWQVSGLSLELTSNYGTAGVQPNNPIFPPIRPGRFVLEWLSTNDWAEGTGTPNLPTADGVTYDSLPDLLAPPRKILSTNLYSPPGDNAPVVFPLPLDTNLLANIAAGQPLTFHFYAADDQIGYLFNSYKYGRGNEPKINVAAVPFLKILSGLITNGGFALTGIGNNHAAYQVEATANLANPHWQVIGTANADAAGAIEFTVPLASAEPQEFYRLSQ